VVSSYTPTLTALLHANRHPARGSAIPRLLIISQPETPGSPPLPGTEVEVRAIQKISSSTGRLATTLLDRQAVTVLAVLHNMKECNWIHTACHAIQDTASPTDSGFLLPDGRLTLAEIMGHHFSHTELAVLTACQTATGDANLPEEAAVHLAAGMMSAGYGSVVATMWAIRDSDGPIIMEKFYEYLMFHAGGNGARAAYALHHAVAHLRDIKGEEYFARWVPLIHFGTCSSSSSADPTR